MHLDIVLHLQDPLPQVRKVGIGVVILGCVLGVDVMVDIGGAGCVPLLATEDFQHGIGFQGMSSRAVPGSVPLRSGLVESFPRTATLAEEETVGEQNLPEEFAGGVCFRLLGFFLERGAGVVREESAVG